jgi:hypothetical protein
MGTTYVWFNFQHIFGLKANIVFPSDGFPSDGFPLMLSLPSDWSAKGLTIDRPWKNSERMGQNLASLS